MCGSGNYLLWNQIDDDSYKIVHFPSRGGKLKAVCKTEALGKHCVIHETGNKKQVGILGNEEIDTFIFTRQ